MQSERDSALLLRYGQAADGNIEKKAQIYTRQEHGIEPRLVDPDAAGVVRRLRGSGFHAFVVGGAVRDLLIGRIPNDFDIATDAHPNNIKRVFRSARIIGRRFRIVHVYCGPEKYIEVTTFRSRSPDGHENQFGTMEEDAGRRDFTINALYYCPVDQRLIDYVGGLPDIRQRRIRTLTPAGISFTEDPVRMLRAVKYAGLTGFPIPAQMGGLIKQRVESVLECSRERLTEEVYKILTTGSSAEILDLAHRLRLFDVLFPAIAESIRATGRKFADTLFAQRLRELDRRTHGGEPLGRESMFGFLFRDLVRAREDGFQVPGSDLHIPRYIRSISAPLYPSKKDLAVAAESILKEAGFFPLPRAVLPGRDHLPGVAARRRRRRSRGHGRRRDGGIPRHSRGGAPHVPPH